MTAYASWFNDFPNRCLTVFERTLLNEEIANNYDVTLLLMTLMTSVVIPHERLNIEPSNKKYINPSGDAINYSLASNIYKRFLDKNFLRFLKNLNCQPSLWKYGTVDNVGKGFESWLNENYTLVNQRKIDKSFTLGGFIKHIRDALSHGNIFVSPSNGEIEEIIFLKGKPKEGKEFIDCVSAQDFVFRYLVSTPKELTIFVRGWIQDMPEPDTEMVIAIEPYY